MPTIRQHTHSVEQRPSRKGRSLARGPAWVVGLVLAAFGLLLFFEVAGTPLSTSGFPDGEALGDRFIGFQVNGWSAWLTTAAGVVVLAGAAQHAVAKASSLLVGLALGAAAVIALFDGNDVLGLAAANGLTALGWGVAAAVLIVTALLPRIGGDPVDVDVDDDGAVRSGYATGTAEHQRRRSIPESEEATAAARSRRDAGDRETVSEPPAPAQRDDIAATHDGVDASEDRTAIHDRADGSEDRTEIRNGDVVSRSGSPTDSTRAPHLVEYPPRER